MIPFVTRATHDREIAAKDAQITKAIEMIAACGEEIDNLTARLARFDANTRKRDARGLFVKES